MTKPIFRWEARFFRVEKVSPKFPTSVRISGGVGRKALFGERGLKFLEAGAESSGVAEEGCADERCVKCFADVWDRIWADAAFRDTEGAGGKLFGHLKDSGVEAEVFLRRTGWADKSGLRFEFPAVDPDEAGGRRQYVNFLLSMNFKKDIQAKL